MHCLDGVLPCSLRDLSITGDRYWPGDDGALELVMLVEWKEQAAPLLHRVGSDFSGNCQLARSLRS